ncbi:MAG: polysaccharide deacetylase family protein [Epulopiscium sp.]|nr:polysaccharide deacetylase family protein [Candidatus Epulonipiscium sp.]
MLCYWKRKTKRAYRLIGIIILVSGCTPLTLSRDSQELKDQTPHQIEKIEKNELENKKREEEKIEKIKVNEIDHTIKDEKENIEIDYNQVQPNEIGHIMVVMYHGILDNPPYHRTAEEFWKDLKYMYDHGYRPISITDYMNQNITVEPGYTPIVLTFDDGLPSTFSFIEENGVLKVNPNSAVGIMNRFAETYPDFGKAATFYINGHDPFEGAGTIKERLEYLINEGYDISNHTYTHADLAKLDSKEIQKEIGKVDAMIKNIVPNYIMKSFSYPFGKRPQEEFRKWIASGSYEGHEYAYEIAFREGPSGPFVPPIHVQYDPYNVPRVRGSEGAEGDLWWYFNYYEKYPKYRYISDGNPNRIAIPKGTGENIQTDKLQEQEIYEY